jgi:hypothetical protein
MIFFALLLILAGENFVTTTETKIHSTDDAATIAFEVRNTSIKFIKRYYCSITSYYSHSGVESKESL